jgi:hypothetical protein
MSTLFLPFLFLIRPVSSESAREALGLALPGSYRILLDYRYVFDSVLARDSSDKPFSDLARLAHNTPRQKTLFIGPASVVGGLAASLQLNLVPYSS